MIRRSREISLPILGCGVLVAFYAWLLASAWRRGMVPQDAATYNFSCFWAAGRLALAGRAVAAFVVAVAVAAVAASLCIAAEGRFPALAAAALTVAAVLATPYCEIADLALLTPAMAFLVREGLARGSAWWERPVLAVAFLSPIGFVATLGMRAVGLGPLMSALLLAVVLVRWRRGRAQASSASSNPAVSATTNSGRRFTSS